MIAETIKTGLNEMWSVERWIDNDIDAGDEAIEIHKEALERAREQFELALAEAERLAKQASDKVARDAIHMEDDAA